MELVATDAVACDTHELIMMKDHISRLDHKSRVRDTHLIDTAEEALYGGCLTCQQSWQAVGSI